MPQSEAPRDPAAAILLRPFQSFFRLESASGILLLFSAVVALVWANSPLAPSSPPAVPTTGKTVLVVDDIAEQRNILTTLLRYCGYEILEAADGEEAIRMAREHCPDLILMDAGLPILDGWEATERLKQDPYTSRIPVVMLTAYALEVHRARALQAGCDSFLTQPVAPRDVLEEVQQWIGPA